MNKGDLPFDFRPASDCIVSSLSNHARNHGIRLADPMVYGLGEGYFFWYADIDPDVSPPVLIGKNVFMEHSFLDNIRAQFKIHEPLAAEDIEASYDHMRSGNPTIIKADPFYFKYIDWEKHGGEPLHFGEHLCIVVKVSGDTAYMADVFEDEIVPIPLQQLRAARSSTEGLQSMLPGNRWYEIEYSRTDLDLGEATRRALQNIMSHMLDSKGNFGLAGIRKASQSHPDRLQSYLADDPQMFVYACGSAAGRMLEGYCGAFNRGMFSRFLAMSSIILDRPDLSDPVLESKAQTAWNELAHLMLNKCSLVSEGGQGGDAGDFREITETYQKAVQCEEDLCDLIASVIMN